METEILVKHITVVANNNYDMLTQQLEAVLGRLDVEVFAKLKEDPQYVEDKIIQMEGAEELILFQIYEHGDLLNIAGKARKAKQYLVGNPRIASLMSRHDIRAALYAPLRVLVFENDDIVQIEYDLPSSLFGQFGNPDVTKIAVSLDQKMERLLKTVDC